MDKLMKLRVKNERRMGMAIRKARTIAEYKILKMLQEEIPDMVDYTLIMDGNEGTVTDSDGNKMILFYDPDSKGVYEKE